MKILGQNFLDTLCGQLEKLLSFQNRERDLIMLQHKLMVERQNGETKTLTFTLKFSGDPHGHSIMSRSVGVNCGAAAQLLLDGHPALNRPGIIAPYTKEACDLIRKGVEREAIKMLEKVVAEI